MLTFLQDRNIFIAGEVAELIPDPDEPRGILVTIALELPSPVNYITITLAI